MPFEMKTLYQPKHPEVLRINPKRQVPVLIDGDLEIFDSTQIFEYFESIKPGPRCGRPSPRRGRACLLEHKSDEVYFPPIIRLMGLQATPDDPAAVDARAAALAFYDGMEKMRRQGVARRLLFLRRHRLLHGADLRRSYGCADDRCPHQAGGLARPA